MPGKTILPHLFAAVAFLVSDFMPALAMPNRTAIAPPAMTAAANTCTKVVSPGAAAENINAKVVSHGKNTANAVANLVSHGATAAQGVGAAEQPYDASLRDGGDTVKPAKPFSERKARRMRRRERIDSLRMELRNRAESGDVLRWGDTLFHRKKAFADGDTLKQANRRMRLERGDQKLSKFRDIVTRHYFHSNVDSAYIRRPDELWTVSLHGHMAGTLLGTRGHAGAIPISGFWTSRLRGTFSVLASCRGIGIGIAINPLKLIGRSSSTTFNVNSYGNRAGFDFSYNNSKTDRGNITYDGVRQDLPQGSLRRREMFANFYWAANGRRFSFPAALTQSFVQRRSAGSLLIGAALQIGDMKINADVNDTATQARLKYADFAIGVGYAHNLVLGRRWLLHCSLLPSLIIYDHDKLRHDGVNSRMRYHFPNIIAKNTWALQYSHHGRFIGLSTVLHGYWKGDEKHLSIYSMRWRSTIYYGLRF